MSKGFKVTVLADPVKRSETFHGPVSYIRAAEAFCEEVVRCKADDTIPAALVELIVLSNPERPLIHWCKQPKDA